eukprot:CAMPEP_0183304998 /NCGR_PEP_ID=MMETSP0160_2-20130417/9884_1 /TAXON_ID=2839 ORGANISM="Odontella Sinensis, Strain Grunow 1884" /NCGR_SAMPLE_ID=MMETSP0160_2 /ASSEMBLY_ACC=CAM_ASM_000250 /LENGTH=287 /DNA_ID=CAMNT_0025468131 /DNA_START=27 /DNA_END=887 /DNA_ORIENTATION=+
MMRRLLLATAVAFVITRGSSFSLNPRSVSRSRPFRRQTGHNQSTTKHHQSLKNDDDSTSVTPPEKNASIALPLGLSIKLLPSTFVFAAIAVATPLLRQVPRQHIAFATCYPLYLTLANRLRFDCNQPAEYKELLPLLREGRGPWFIRYVTTFGFVGLILPALLVFAVGAPSAVANAAAPHLFLTASQVVMESLSRGPRFYALCRILVPIGFNAYRMGPLWTWTRVAWSQLSSSSSAAATMPFWETAGLVLATLSLVLWTYNLFIFLLLRVVPQYLNRVEFPDAKVAW